MATFNQRKINNKVWFLVNTKYGWGLTTVKKLKEVIIYPTKTDAYKAFDNLLPM